MLKRGTVITSTVEIHDLVTKGASYYLLEDQHDDYIKIRDNNSNHFFLTKGEYKLPGAPDFVSSVRSNFVKEHGSICDELKAITERKNSDYTGNTDDPFANFRQVETFNICTTEQGFLTRMTDKMSRVASLIGQGTEAKVKDESIEDTLKDLANYSILLICYLRQKREK